MNWEMIAGLVRHVLTFGGGYLVAKGLVDEQTMTAGVAGVLSLGALVWSIIQKRKAPVE